MLNEKLAVLRSGSGMTQEQVADRMFVSRELVSKWERGSRKPDINALKKLSGLYGVKLEYLLEEEKDLILELEGCVPDGVQIGAERLPLLLNAFLGTLSDRDRGVFVRRYYFLETPSDIANAFGIRENYARTILARTRKKFTKYIKEAAR